MVQEAEVKVKLKAEGAEETRARLLETRAALVGVSSDQLKNAQSQRQAARDAQVLNNVEAYQNRIFLAKHPVLNQATRAMKDFGSVSRGVLSITTAFSTVISAFNSTRSGMGQLTADLEQAKREQIFALKTYGYDSKEYADATSKLNGYNSELKTFNDQLKQEQFLGIGTTIATAVLAANQGINAYTKVAAFFAKGSVLSVAVAAGISFFAVLAGVVASVAIALYAVLTPGDQVADFFKTFFPESAAAIDEWGQKIDDVFTKSIPGAFIFMGNSLRSIWDTIANAFSSFWGGMVNTVTGAVNTIITSVQSAIDWIARLPSTIGGGIVNGISGGLGALIQQQRHGPQNARAGGGMITEPVMGIGLNSGQTWTFGEAGPEMVVPMGGFSGGGGGNTLIINYNNPTFTGDMAFRRSVDNAVKETLKRHGW